MKTTRGKFLGLAVLLTAALITLAGCGSPDGGPTGNTDPTVDKVTVSPAPAAVARGGTKTFTAAVTGTNNPAQTVKWTMSGSKSASTTLIDGVLNVGTGETEGETLTITATSLVDPSKSGNATVTVSGLAAVTSVTVNPSTATVVQGGTFTFTAAVTGTDSPAQTVTWEVTGSGNSITAGGVLTVAANASAGTTLTVTATSKLDPTKSGTATVLVTGPGLYSGTDTTPKPDTETLVKAITWLKNSAENGGIYTIKVGVNESLVPTTLSSTNLHGATNVSITLTTVDTTPRTVQLTGQGSIFIITEPTLTFTLAGHIVIRGISNNNRPLIMIGNNSSGGIGGTLVLQDNAKITGNRSSHVGEPSAGGVWVNGTFNMTGGEISDNHMTAEDGGGVHVWANGNTSTFTMSGGLITGNTATAGTGHRTGNGGGVVVHSNGTGGSSQFFMEGGTISGNTAYGGNDNSGSGSGGGVYVNGKYGNEIFEMSGSAVISGNTAKSIGGGVFVQSESSGISCFYMSDETRITGNKAAIGGGIGVLRAAFGKNGGLISGNTASGGSFTGGLDIPPNTGSAVMVIKAEEDGVEAYRNSDADAGTLISITWNGSAYTEKVGFEGP